MADVYEKDLAQKTSLTTSDYIRVVGSDNVSYKQSIPSVANIFGSITRLNSDTDDYDTLYGESPSFKVYAVGNRVQHAPDGQWFFLTSYRAENSYITQVAYGMTTSDIFTRRFQIGTTGTAWTKLPTRAEVDALTNKQEVTATVYSNRVTINSQACYRLGNVVYVNIDLTANQALSQNTVLQGLPVPSAPQYLSISVNNAYAQITSVAVNGIIMSGVSSGQRIWLSGSYVI